MARGWLVTRREAARDTAMRTTTLRSTRRSTGRTLLISCTSEAKMRRDAVMYHLVRGEHHLGDRGLVGILVDLINENNR